MSLSLSRQSMTLFMLLVFVSMVGVALTYPAGARFMPLTVGVPGIALCLLQIVLDMRRNSAAIEDHDEIREAEEKAARLVGHEVHFEHAQVIDAPRDKADVARREVIAWGYFLGFVGGVLMFGFWISIPIFLITFLQERAKATWKRALLLGGGASVIFYVVFTKVLGVTLYGGAITGWILDRFGT
jgi:uncharacterized membrane protein